MEMLQYFVENVLPAIASGASWAAAAVFVYMLLQLIVPYAFWSAVAYLIFKAICRATGAVALGITVEDELWWRKMRDKVGVGAPGTLVTREVQLTKHEIEAAVAYYIEHSRNRHEE